VFVKDIELEFVGKWFSGWTKKGLANLIGNNKKVFRIFPDNGKIDDFSAVSYFRDVKTLQ
jgi:hypothetical protein